MSNVPTTQPEAFDLALVTVAVESLRSFAGELDRDLADQLLAHWRFAKLMSEAEIAAVLRRFDPPAPVPDHEGWHAGGRYRLEERIAKPGEVCSCGLAATVVYHTDHGDVGFCGVNRG